MRRGGVRRNAGARRGAAGGGGRGRRRGSGGGIPAGCPLRGPAGGTSGGAGAQNGDRRTAQPREAAAATREGAGCGNNAAAEAFVAVPPGGLEGARGLEWESGMRASLCCAGLGENRAGGSAGARRRDGACRSAAGGGCSLRACREGLTAVRRCSHCAR